MQLKKRNQEQSMCGGDGTLENAVSPSKNSLATATFRLYKSDKFGWIFSGKAEDISEKCSRHCQKAQWSHSFEINPDERLLIFCQITSYPKLQEERFKKEITDFNNGNGCFEQLRTGNIRTSRNQTSQQESPNNLDYKNCWAHNTEVIVAMPWAIQCSHITVLKDHADFLFLSRFPLFYPPFLITHVNL